MSTTDSSQASIPAIPEPSNGRDYLPAERQDIILNILTRRNVVTVAELADILHTTEITVRRDLAFLNSAGLLKRVRGGAMSISGATGRDDTPLAQAGIGMPSATMTDTGATAKRNAEATVNNAGPAVPTSDGAITPTIGVMLPAPSFFWPVVIEHMNVIAQRQGLRIVTRNTTYEPDVREDELLDELINEPGICGLIVTPSAHAESGLRTWDWIERHTGIPVVAVERDLPPFATRYIDSVLTNHIYGVRKAAAHFLRHGHTRIGAAFTTTPTSGVIEDGWRRIVAASGGEVEGDGDVFGDGNGRGSESGHGGGNLRGGGHDNKRGMDGVRDHRQRIDCSFIFHSVQPYDVKGVNRIADTAVATGVTAMLVHSDYLAISLAQALERRGKRVPGDVSIISIDGFVTPALRPLTVLHSSEEDIAEAAVGAVLNRIAHPESTTRHIYVDPALIDRGSVVDVAGVAH